MTTGFVFFHSHPSACSFVLLSTTPRAQALSLGQLESRTVLKQESGALRIEWACREAFGVDTDRAFHKPSRVSE